MKNHIEVLRSLVFYRLGVVAIFSLWISACQVESIKDDGKSAQVDTGQLELSFSSRRSRTLQPNVSLEVASYRLVGAGPNEKVFELTVEEGNRIHLDALEVGPWNIMAEAFNAEGYLFSRGAVNVDIQLAYTSNATLLMSMLDDTGSFSLSLDIPDTLSSSPIVTGFLQSESQVDIPLDFSLGAEKSGYSTYQVLLNNSVPAGYYTLMLSVKDQNVIDNQQTAYTGLAEAVRILEGQTTSGSYVVNGVLGGAAASLDIQFELQQAIDVFFVDPSAYPQSFLYDSDTSFTVTANVAEDDADAGAINYEWFLNGELVGSSTTSTYDKGIDLSLQANVVALTDPGAFGLTVDSLDGTGAKVVNVPAGTISAGITSTQHLANILNAFQTQLDSVFENSEFNITTNQGAITDLTDPLASPTYLVIERYGHDVTNFTSTLPTGVMATLFGDPTTDTSTVAGLSGNNLTVEAKLFTNVGHSIAGTSTTSRTLVTPSLQMTGFLGGDHAVVTSTVPTGTIVGDFDTILNGGTGASIIFDIEVTDINSTTTSLAIQLDENILTGGGASAIVVADITNVTIDDLLAEISAQIAADAPMTAVLTVGGAAPITLTGATAGNGDTLVLVPNGNTPYDLSNLGFGSANRTDSGAADVDANNAFRMTVTASLIADDSNAYNINIPAASYVTLGDLAMAIQAEIDLRTGANGLSGRVSVEASGGQLVFANTEVGAGYGITLEASTGLGAAAGATALASLEFDDLFIVVGTDPVDHNQYYPGHYRLDVIATNQDHSRIGSTHYLFEVVGNMVSASSSYVFDFINMGAYSTDELLHSLYSISGSEWVNVSNNGLGIIGGGSDMDIDSDEMMTFRFSSPVSDLYYFVGMAESSDGDNLEGESTVHIYDDQDLLLGSYLVNGSGQINLSTLTALPISKLEVIAHEPIRISKIGFGNINE